MVFKFKLLTAILIVSAASCTHREVSKMPPPEVRNHSYSNYDSVVPTHMHMELSVDFKRKILEGKVQIAFENKKNAPYIILDTRQLNITGVKLDDSTEAAWSLGEEKEFIGKPLVIELAPNTRMVSVYYSTSPESEALMWLEPAQTAGKKHPFMFTQSQAILARTWLPCMDVPAVRCTYTATITCDHRYMALMSASNPQRKNLKGVYRFAMDQPVPSYLMALAVGDIGFKSLGKNCGVYAEPAMLEQSATEFTALPDMIQSAGALYGDYAWGRYDILVLPPSFPFGGMENPRLTFATPTIIAGDKSLVSLIAHELAHSWSGNIVTNRTWDDFWLNEGFTVYFEERIMEKIYGKDYADMLAALSYGELQLTLNDLMTTAPGDTKLKLNLKNRNPDDGLSDIAYIKGSLVLKLLEKTYGRKTWDNFLRSYFNHFKWKTVSTEDFLSYLDEHLIKTSQIKAPDLSEWIYGVGLPANCPKISSREFVRIEAMAGKINTGKSLKYMDTAGFTTHHWLHLLRNLNSDSIQGLMSELDTTYGLSKSNNSEIQCDWYLHCIRNNYTQADVYIENYLLNVGRRKFLKPIYEALSQTPEGLEKGRAIYRKAETSYHAVSRNTIREILKIGDAEAESRS